MVCGSIGFIFIVGLGFGRNTSWVLYLNWFFYLVKVGIYVC